MLKVRKSKTLVLDCSESRTGEVLAHQFSSSGEVFGALTSANDFLYLGRPFGSDYSPQPADYAKEIVEELRMVGQSLLAPWQKLEAIQTFVLSRLQYLIWNSELGASVSEEMEVYRLLRYSCSVGHRASRCPPEGSATTSEISTGPKTGPAVEQTVGGDERGSAVLDGVIGCGAEAMEADVVPPESAFAPTQIDAAPAQPDRQLERAEPYEAAQIEPAEELTVAVKCYWCDPASAAGPTGVVYSVLMSLIDLSRNGLLLETFNC